MRLEITPANAQEIADKVSAATFALLKNHSSITEDQFNQAETKALLNLGYQPAVYHRKMNNIWEEKPWNFRAFEYMSEDDFM